MWAQLATLLLFVTTISLGQGNGFDLKKISFNGLNFSVTKEAIVKTFGQGEKIETNYDCGFFTNTPPLGPYYQLKYADFNYIGSDNESFYLQNVSFDAKGMIKISYGDKELTGQTTKIAFARIFGDKAKEHFEKYPENDTLLLLSTFSDDGARFTFKNGRLIKFEYWTPC